MKKSLAIIICAFVVLATAACGKSDTEKLTTDEIEQKIAGLLDEDYVCDTDIDVQQLKDYYRLDMSKVKEYTAKESKIPSVIPDTVIVLRTDKNMSIRQLKCSTAHSPVLLCPSDSGTLLP